MLGFCICFFYHVNSFFQSLFYFYDVNQRDFGLISLAELEWNLTTHVAVNCFLIKRNWIWFFRGQMFTPLTVTVLWRGRSQHINTKPTITLEAVCDGRGVIILSPGLCLVEGFITADSQLCSDSLLSAFGFRYLRDGVVPFLLTTRWPKVTAIWHLLTLL